MNQKTKQKVEVMNKQNSGSQKYNKINTWNFNKKEEHKYTK